MDTPFRSSGSLGWPLSSRAATPPLRDLFGDESDSDDGDSGYQASEALPQSLIDKCLKAYAQAAGTGPDDQPSLTDKARALATISLLAKGVTGTRMDLHRLLFNQGDDNDDDGDEWGDSKEKSTVAQPARAQVTRADLDAFPSAAWSELDAYVRQENGRGITAVVLPQNGDPSRLIQSLGSLPALSELDVSLQPDCEVIDLGGLKPQDLGQLAITLRGNASGLTVIAPAGSHVKAANQCVALHKSRVFYVDAYGQQTGTSRTLAGAAYHHTTDDKSQEFSVTTHLNGQATFGSITSTLLDSPGDPIVCRTLSMLWLMQRHQHHQEGETKAGPGVDTKSYRPFSYAFAATAGAISESVTNDTVHEEEGIMFGSQADALFDTDGFGNMLSQQFQRMASGDKRFFMTSTPNHMLGVELQVKEAMHAGTLRREYVVNLYDPNSTTTHTRVVAHDAQWFESQVLERWLGRVDVGRYFPGDPKIGALVRWIPPSERPVGSSQVPTHEVDIHVDEADQLTDRFMWAAMSRGAPSAVTASVRGILASDTTADDKWLALRGENISNRPALEVACDRDQPATVAAYIRAVLEADTTTLPLRYQLDLLRAVDNEQPVLAFAAAQSPQKRTENAIYSYVYEIASSSLALGQKQALLGGTGSHSTAAQLALRIAPERVAAMMCAIHDANLLADETQALLAALRVRDEDILKVMFEREDAQTDLHAPMEKTKTSEVVSRQAAWMYRLGQSTREHKALDGQGVTHGAGHHLARHQEFSGPR